MQPEIQALREQAHEQYSQSCFFEAIKINQQALNLLVKAKEDFEETLLEYLAPKEKEIRDAIEECHTAIEAKLLEFKKAGNALFVSRDLELAIETFSQGASYYSRQGAQKSHDGIKLLAT